MFVPVMPGAAGIGKLITQLVKTRAGSVTFPDGCSDLFD